MAIRSLAENKSRNRNKLIHKGAWPHATFTPNCYRYVLTLTVLRYEGAEGWYCSLSYYCAVSGYSYSCPFCLLSCLCVCSVLSSVWSSHLEKRELVTWQVPQVNVLAVRSYAFAALPLGIVVGLWTESVASLELLHFYPRYTVGVKHRETSITFVLIIWKNDLINDILSFRQVWSNWSAFSILK